MDTVPLLYVVKCLENRDCAEMTGLVTSLAALPAFPDISVSRNLGKQTAEGGRPRGYGACILKFCLEFARKCVSFRYS